MALHVTSNRSGREPRSEVYSNYFTVFQREPATVFGTTSTRYSLRVYNKTLAIYAANSKKQLPLRGFLTCLPRFQKNSVVHHYLEQTWCKRRYFVSLLVEHDDRLIKQPEFRANELACSKNVSACCLMLGSMVLAKAWAISSTWAAMPSSRLCHVWK